MLFIFHLIKKNKIITHLYYKSVEIIRQILIYLSKYA